MSSSDIFRFTIDVESDFGGRDNSIRGIEIGVPQILDAFDKYHIKAIFFLSTKKLLWYLPIARQILGRGHTIGSHGHKHINWRNRKGWYDDFLISQRELKDLLDVDVNLSLYRAPWFSHNNCMVYDRPENHVSILKHTWFKQRIPKDPIFYIHPFDIVHAPRIAPNLFCKILYSRHEAVLATFHKLLQEYC